MSLVRACLTELPRLMAQESILAALRVSVGSGTLTRDSAREIHRSWSEHASPRAIVATPSTPADVERSARAFEQMARAHAQPPEVGTGE